MTLPTPGADAAATIDARRDEERTAGTSHVPVNGSSAGGGPDDVLPLDLRYLGPIAAERSGEAVALGGPRQRAVLARLLLSRGEMVTAERLADDLWSGEPPPSATNTLQSYISLLRRALGDPSLLRREGPGYVAAVPAEAVDGERFRRDASAGLRLVADDPRAALPLLDRALSHWRGDALAEVCEEPWATPTATELTQLRLAVVERRFDALLATGQHAAAVGEIELAVEAEPLREGLTAQLMVALYRSGRQADALRAFARTRERLLDELGLDPTPELVALERRILDHDPSLAPAGTPAQQAPPVQAPQPAPQPAPPPATRPRSPVPLPGAASRALSTTAVGRARELAALTRTWERCAQGQRHLVVLRGEPGIGKTNLAARFAAAAHADGAIVLWGRATAHGVVPFEPIVEAIRTAIRTVSNEAKHRVVEGRDALGLLLPDLDQLVPGVERHPVDETTEHYVLFETVAGLLDAESSAHPYLLVVDDLHWADALSLRLLDHVLRHERPGRLLIVTTMRSTPEESDPMLAPILAGLARDGFADTYDLGGLDADETTELLVSAGWDPEQGRAVYDLTAGNPFFVAELAARPPTTVMADLPPTITEMIGLRLDRLGGEPTRVLAAAAVAGPAVSLPVLAAVTDLEGDELLDAIDVTIAARLLADDGPTGRLAFPHALVRQAILQRLTNVRRRGLHLRVAEALSATGEAAASPTERAHHLFEAGDLATRAERVAAAVAAGRFALAMLARDDALAWVGRAVALLDVEHPERHPDVDTVGVRLLETDAALALGDRERARAAAAAAVAAARATHDPIGFARAAIAATKAVAGVGFDFGGADPALIDLVQEAIDRLPSDHVDLRVRLLASLCGALVEAHDHERQRAAAAEAVELAGASHDAGLVAAAQIARRLAAWHRDELEERIAAGRAAVDAARRAGDRHSEFTALLYLTGDLLEAGRPQESRAVLDELRQLTRSLHQVTYDVYVTFIDGTYALMEGRFDEAQLLSETAMAAGLAAHGLNAQQAYGAQLFCLAWDRGQLASVLPLVESVVAMVPDMRIWQVAQAAALVDAGRDDEARAIVDSMLVDGRLDVPDDSLFFTAVCYLVEVARALDHREAAAVLRVALEPYAGRVAVTGLGGLSIGPLRRYLGVACQLVGDLDAADEHLRVAADEARSMSARPHVARALRDHARVLCERGGPGDRELARELATEAIAIADEVGMALRGIPEALC